MSIQIKHFFDPETSTLTYVVHDPRTRDGIVIDPVLDFDPPAGKVEDRNARLVVDYIKMERINLLGILETHAHADHLSSSQLFKQQFPQAKIGIGEKIKLVQEVFKNHFHLDYVRTDASQFDILFKDHQTVSFGSLAVKALPTPGHTPACMSYLIEDALFTGDALFMPDYGTGRCDFPKGSAKDLYHSIMKQLYTLPDNTRVFVGHDYLPNGREMRCETTIGESKKSNVHIKATTVENEYIAFREGRDKTLKAPRLLLPSLQVNIDAGHLPPKEDNGKSYLKLPLNPQVTLGKL